MKLSSEKRAVPVTAVVVLLAIASCAKSPEVAVRQQADIVIKGVTLIDGTGSAPRPDMTIVISDGRIVAVLPDSEASEYRGTKEIDATGKYVIPGLADMHVHFGLGSPLRTELATTEKVLARELYYGVTTILQLGATDGSTESIISLRSRRSAGTLKSPYIYGTGGHLTLQGTHPIYTIFPPGVQQAADDLAAETPLDEPVDLYRLGIGISFVRTPEAAIKAVRERAEGGMDAIKITVESGPTTFGDDHPQMPVEMIRAIVTEAKKHGLKVFAHVTSLDELESVLEGGAAGAVHSVWDYPMPGSELADRMADAGFVLVPTLSLYSGAIALRYIDDPVDLSDPFLRETLTDAEASALTNPSFVNGFRRRGVAIVPQGTSSKEAIEQHLADIWDSVSMLHDRGVPVVLGTDTGNPYVFPGYSVHLELELLVRAGLTPMEALIAGSRRAAEMLGKESEFGTIEPGMRADLLILAKNPLQDIRNTRTLESVISEGQVVDREALVTLTELAEETPKQ